MDWITEQIAIGNVEDAEAVREGDLDAILCLRPGCSCEARDDVDVEFLPLIDGPGNPSAIVLEALEFLRVSLAAGERVLVHCHAGRSRSVCVVAAWLMAEGGLSRAASLRFVQERRTGGIWLTPGIEGIFAAVDP